MNRNLQATAGAAVYRWHIEERRYEHVSPGIAAVTGYCAEDVGLMGREQFVARIHPEDRARVRTEVESVLQGGRGTVFYRFLRRDGTYRLLVEHLYVVMEGERRIFLDGLLRDITDRVSPMAWSSPGKPRRDGFTSAEAIGTPVRPSFRRKLLSSVVVAALLAITLGAGYVTGLRHAALRRAGTASLANTPRGASVVSSAAKPGARNASGRRDGATKRARVIATQAFRPQFQAMRQPVAALPSVRPVGIPPQAPALRSSGAMKPSFWSRVAHTPQPIAPDPPSFR